MDDDALTFGPWLKRRRQALHITQQQLGELAYCAGETIRKYEIGERRPSVEMTGLLAAALQVQEVEHAAFVRFARGEHVSPPPPLATSLRLRPLQSPSNLPIPLTPLIGRDTEMTVLRAL